MANFKAISIAIIISICFCSSINAKDMNCLLRQNSNYVTDAYGMYANTSTKPQCLKKCKDYAKKSIKSLADSEVITKLSWTCTFNKKDIHTEKLK